MDTKTNQGNLPIVSIVIPAFNHGAYLMGAIESVLIQDYPNLELIVLNDGSTDNTAEILKQYEGCFYWETQSNIGQAKTLNKGWAMAKGDILGYLSADDFLLPGAVRKLVKCLLVNKGAVLCYPNFQLVDSKSRVIRNVIAPDYNYFEMVTKLLCAPGPGALFLKQAYLRAGEWNPSLRRFPDYEYWLRLGLEGDFIHLSENLAAFRVHEESFSFSETNINDSEEASRIISAYYLETKHIPGNVQDAKRLALSNSIMLSAQLHLRSGRYLLGVKRIFKAILLSPFLLLSIRSYKLIFHGVFNRLLYKLLFILK